MMKYAICSHLLLQQFKERTCKALKMGKVLTPYHASGLWSFGTL